MSNKSNEFINIKDLNIASFFTGEQTHPDKTIPSEKKPEKLIDPIIFFDNPPKRKESITSTDNPSKLIQPIIFFDEPDNSAKQVNPEESTNFNQAPNVTSPANLPQNAINNNNYDYQNNPVANNMPYIQGGYNSCFVLPQPPINHVISRIFFQKIAEINDEDCKEEFDKPLDTDTSAEMTDADEDCKDQSNTIISDFADDVKDEITVTVEPETAETNESPISESVEESPSPNNNDKKLADKKEIIRCIAEFLEKHFDEYKGTDQSADIIAISDIHKAYCELHGDISLKQYSQCFKKEAHAKFGAKSGRKRLNDKGKNAVSVIIGIVWKSEK